MKISAKWSISGASTILKTSIILNSQGTIRSRRRRCFDYTGNIIIAGPWFWVCKLPLWWKRESMIITRGLITNDGKYWMRTFRVNLNLNAFDVVRILCNFKYASSEFQRNYVPLWVLFRKWTMKGVCLSKR